MESSNKSQAPSISTKTQTSSRPEEPNVPETYVLQLPELGASLEHALRVGSHWKRSKRRTEEWKRLQVEEFDREANGSTLENIESVKRSRMQSHTEDMRLYGTLQSDHSEGDRWPALSAKRTKPVEGASQKAELSGSLMSSDAAWDKEYSDGIHPVTFSSERLADALPPDKSELLNLRRSGLARTEIDPTKCDIDPADAAHALILRSWERAVHVAANTVCADPHRYPSECELPEKISYTREQSMNLCNNLGLTLRNDAACPSCGADLSYAKTSDQVPETQVPETQLEPTSTRLSDHYYGTEHVTGCCWHQIAVLEQTNIQRILESEVQAHLVPLCQLIVSKAKEVKQQHNANKTECPVFGWSDILAMLESSLKSTDEVGNGIPEPARHSNRLLNTLQVSSELIPLLINEPIMESIRRRLIERYADVPS